MALKGLFYKTRDLVTALDDALREVKSITDQIDRYRRPDKWMPHAAREAKLLELREALVDLEKQIGRSILLEEDNLEPLKRRYTELADKIAAVLAEVRSVAASDRET